jgi:AcrR family transcriptional regulator
MRPTRPSAAAPAISFLDDPALCGTPVQLAALPDVRTRLLAAAERLLLQGGMAAVALRRIAALAEAHPGQVAYYFGNLAGLLDALADANLTKMLGGRETILLRLTGTEAASGLPVLLDALLEPLLYAAALTHDAPTSLVLRELISGTDPAARQPWIERINASVDQMAHLLGQALPHLDAVRLMLRLRLITGAAVYLAPNVESVGIFKKTASNKASLKRAYAELHMMAMLTMTAP